jgi:phosphoesterase RecJ-like protein
MPTSHTRGAGDWSMLIDALKAAKRLAIFTHQRPDPDAVGSQVGLASLLSQAGNTGVVMEFPPVPESLKFILDASPWPVLEFNAAWPVDRLAEFDTVVVVDTSSREQLSPAFALLDGSWQKLLCIDHHLAADIRGRCIYRDSTAGSCAEIIVRLADEFGGLNLKAANALLAGITADTGWFHFEGTSAGTLRAAAVCVAAGARPEELWNRLMQQDTVAKWKLAGRALQTTQYAVGGRLALMCITQRDFIETGAKSWETEGLINYPLSIADVAASACLSEQADGVIRVSLRSKHTINVAEIAAEFGGGGHARAAGCRMTMPMDGACRALTEAFEWRLSVALRK